MKDNKEFKRLFEESGMKKSHFATAIGMKRQNLSNYLEDVNEMHKSTFEVYRKNYIIHINLKKDENNL